MKRGRFNALPGGIAVACALVTVAAVAQENIGTPHRADAIVQPSVPVPDVDSCIRQLDPQLDIGYDRIAARCPDLARQLDKGPWAPWLPRGWKEPGNDFSAGSLREFRELVARESTLAASARAPDVRHLKVVLTRLAGTNTEGWWSRFKSWLRSILEAREQPTDESWFTRMVSHVGFSQSVIQLISYAALAVVVLLAAVIVLNEARTAGLIRKRVSAARSTRGRAETSVADIAWSDVERASPVDRPRLLLELIVRRLSDRGLLPPAGGLTVRELTRAARLSEAEDRSRLADVALAAEKIRYSVRSAPSVEIDDSISRGRELLDRLDSRAPE